MLLICGSKGENGAGKNTFMKMLYGVIKPDQGDMFFIMDIKELADTRDLAARLRFEL
ncbi:ATP-binding cassette domain-containing protein [Pseudoalteromonas sp. S3431]|uniref:ATP-binding cassette domain-containing protein n=1 Tax=Pseudoalteromonas sp. S3431 TaxID=579537 RepID=UPI0012FBDC52|nr:ATP-binding cassette domain-containing protein [Pseudoalteromonas sp. S3431]